MWVEKYRPAKLSEVVDQKEIIGSIEALLKNTIRDASSCCSLGLQGLEKQLQRYVLQDKFLGDYLKDNVLELNASDERGINMVREKVKKFSKIMQDLQIFHLRLLF